MSLFNLSFGKNLGFDPTSIASPLTNVRTSMSNVVNAGAMASTIAAGTTTSVETTSTDGEDILVTGAVDDTRLRIVPGLTSTVTKQVLGAHNPSENVLSILHDTRGLMFPYTPSVSVNQSVNWDPISLIQNNYDVNSYQRTPSVGISLTGIFTTQNSREGEYVMAVLHFLRTVTKSYFGNIDRAAGKAGTPPPVLYLDGFGDFMFNNLPVVIKSYSYAFDENTDSNVFTARSGAKARLPAKLSISIELGVQINMTKQRKEFSLDSFRTGQLLKSSNNNSTGGWF